MIASPARSFTDPPGFMNSALPRISQPVAAEARRNWISGVLPMLPARSSATGGATVACGWMSIGASSVTVLYPVRAFGR